MTGDARVVAEDVVFAEAPRWHDGRLWFSDMHGEAVYTVDLEGRRDTVLELRGRRPSGLGFLPDGSLLVVSMIERQVLRWDGQVLAVHADLASLEADGCNDMVVDQQGFAYVGSFPPPARPAGTVYVVDPGGGVRVAAENVVFPNGSAISPDGRTLIVAESLGRRFSRFDVQADGSLANRAIFADCPGFGPDGICLDESGAIWAAMPLGHQFQRIAPGGEVLDTLGTGSRLAIACALGGPDRRHLFLLTATEHAPEALRGTRNSRIEVLVVGTAGAGLP